MPRRKGEFHPIEEMYEKRTMEERMSVKGGQIEWYKLAGKYTKGYTVIDIGAGTGYGIKILKELGAKEVDGIDPAPGRCVRKGRGEDVENHYDWVVCIDVIEHVIDDIAFLKHLLEIARVGVFLTTPNYNVYGASNWHHYREYTPEELRILLTGLKYEIWNFDASECDPPKKVKKLDECTIYGVVIWKSRPQNG
jgi:2-polyprenyl-3-methyl-5-hydroxy-6-metoxy-1,4-benzoquinol methylase